MAGWESVDERFTMMKKHQIDLAGKNDDVERSRGLRLPDFLEFATDLTPQVKLTGKIIA